MSFDLATIDNFDLLVVLDLLELYSVKSAMILAGILKSNDHTSLKLAFNISAAISHDILYLFDSSVGVSQCSNRENRDHSEQAHI